MIINSVMKNCFDILGNFGKFFEKNEFTQRFFKEKFLKKLCVLLLVLSPTSWAYDEKWYAAIQTEVLFDTPEQACEQYPIDTINPSCTYSRTERVYDGLNLSSGSCMYLCGNNQQEQNLVNAGKRICFRESQMFVLNNGVWTCTNVIKPDTPDMGPANPPAQCSAPKKGVGNPINVTNGNKYQREVDFVFAGPSTSLNLIRHYNSLNDSVGPFGRGWSADFGVKVEEFEVYDSPPSDTSEEPLKLMQIVSVSTGRRLEFESINGSYQVLNNKQVNLDENSSGWVFKSELEDLYTFNSEGKIQSIKNISGIEKVFTYNSSGELEKIEDTFGNAIYLTYQNGFVHTAVILDYGTFTYGYTGDLLTTVTFLGEQQGATLQTKTYVYEDPNFSYLLTGIIDESGERFATWSYDAQGRAVSSEHGQTKEKVTVRYDSATQTTVFNSFDKETVYFLEKINGITQIIHLESKPSPNCALSNQTFTYYADGTLKSKTGAKGNTTTYIRDALGRETSRTEASGTPHARTITTEYHPTWNKPIRIIEPGLTTEYQYDPNNGRLLNTKKINTTAP